MTITKEVKIQEVVESTGEDTSTSLYKIIGSRKDVAPVSDALIVIEGLALMARVVSKYKEQDIEKTQKEMVEYLSQAIERHNIFKLMEPRDGKNISKPNN